jgi:hypothetical protein
MRGSRDHELKEMTESQPTNRGGAPLEPQETLSPVTKPQFIQQRISQKRNSH